MLSKGAGPYPAAWITSEASRNVKFYNNIYAGAPDGSGYKSFHLNATGPAVWDYNLYIASGMSWALSQNSALSSVSWERTRLKRPFRLLSLAWGASQPLTPTASQPIARGLLVAEPGRSHTSSSLARPRVAAAGPMGPRAAQLRDMGAWGNGATQIGCNFAGGSSFPPVPYQWHPPSQLADSTLRGKGRQPKAASPTAPSTYPRFHRESSSPAHLQSHLIHSSRNGGVRTSSSICEASRSGSSGGAATHACSQRAWESLQPPLLPGQPRRHGLKQRHRQPLRSRTHHKRISRL